MQKQDKKKFVEVLTSLSDLYDASLSENAIQLYWDLLKEYAIDDFVLSAKVHTTSSKWMPKPSDFVLAINSSSTNGAEKALIAWAAVSAATKNPGGNASVKFDDPLIHAVIRNLGGWASLCESSATYFQNNTRRQFISTYESMYNICAKGLRVDGLLPLKGRTNDRQVDIPTKIPHGPQHFMLTDEEEKLLLTPRGENNENTERVGAIISGISKATKIDNPS